jgi:thioredoxin reductase
MSSINAAIIGAGPYALSIATHLRQQRIECRIFGEPMHAWMRMPAGMFLKSPGLASNLCDPSGRFTLKQFSLENQLPYHDLTTAIPLDTFVQYGQSFQQRLVPYVERRLVTSVDRSANGQGYALRLDDDEVVTARRVVIATGMSGFQYVPPVLAGLPPDSLSHTSDHHDLTQFRARDVSVIGRGSSALDVAALLHHDAGAKVRIVARRAPLIGSPPVEHRPLRSRVRRPLSRLGTGWWLLLCTEAPMLFRFLPASTRSHLVRTTLGPAGGWHLQDQIVGHIPIDIGTVQHAERRGTGQVELRIAGADGTSTIVTDHVIAGTGYQVDVRRSPFLGRSLLSSIRTVRGAPVLSGDFESSLPGLYFVGVMAAATFGPVMRFVAGARYTAHRLSRHLALGGQARRASQWTPEIRPVR